MNETIKWAIRCYEDKLKVLESEEEECKKEIERLKEMLSTLDNKPKYVEIKFIY